MTTAQTNTHPTARTAALEAQAAVEAIGVLNHTTQVLNEGAEWQLPGDVYDVVGQLVALAGRLPQAIDQAHRLVRQAELSGRVRHEDGPEYLDRALRRLTDATEWAFDNADLLHTSLSYMHAALAPLGHTEVEREGQ